jgi:hypothetical protein
MEVIVKCLSMDIVPVLIGRRIHYSTFRIFHTCGFIFHETFNQLLAVQDEDVADLIRDKKLLGYHNVRVGDQPDARLRKFIETNLPQQIAPARQRFNEYKDLLNEYAFNQMKWPEFAARVRRRELGVNEDSDHEPLDDY